jgi:hypothetical protein
MSAFSSTGNALKDENDVTGHKQRKSRPLSGARAIDIACSKAARGACRKFSGETMTPHLTFFIPLARALACVFPLLCTGFVPDARAQAPFQSFELMEATIPQLQAALAAGTITSKELVTAYLARIEAYDQRGPALNAISVLNGKALDEALAMDAERRAGKTRGLLHGVPIIVKDNYETAGMQTAAG